MKIGGVLSPEVTASYPPWRGPFRSAHRLAIVAMAFLVLSIVVGLLTISLVHDYFFLTFGEVTLGGSLLAGLVGVGCVVSFLFWFSRVYRNLPALGAKGLQQSPRLAVALWFAPIVNFWMPLQVVASIWKASEPVTTDNDPATRRAVPFPALLAVWWMGWLTALVLDNLLAAPDRIAYQGQLVTLPIVVATASDILAAGLAMAVILEIDRRQTRKHALLAESPAS